MLRPEVPLAESVPVAVVASCSDTVGSTSGALTALTTSAEGPGTVSVMH